jgi:FAD:protein FMN transferase
MSNHPSVSFPALGTTAIVSVTETERLEPARRTVERVIAEFDLACSRFREDSELSALNAAAGSAVAVSPLLLDAVEAALRAARLTDGDVDPTVGEALIALGYDRDFAAVAARSPAPARPISFAAVPGWRAIALDRPAGMIRVPRGVTLDLGATAKALAADRAAAAALREAGCGTLVGLGGDIAVAGSSPDGGWRIRVTDDHRGGTEAPGQWITIRSGGLATSSTTTRRWDAGGQSAHHLVDPATGGPAAVVWRTASVAAGTCLDANIASTAAIIRGEPAAAWLQSLELPSRLVRGDGTVVHLAGWPADGDDLAPSAPAGRGREAVA